MKIRIFSLLFGFALSNVAMAYKEADLQKLLKTKSCENCDLSQASFGDVDLTNANLRGANLEHAALGKVRLVGADLMNADLTHGVFFKVDFRGARTQGVRRTNALFFICKGINF